MVNYKINAVTNEITEEIVPDVVEIIQPIEPTLEEQILALQQAVLELTLGGLS